MMHCAELYRYERTIQARHERSGPYEAEIVPGADPMWHVITTPPGHESIAAAHLIARRFGVYVPMIDRKQVINGKEVIRSSPMFPKYVFLFVWDLEAHWRRIRSCTGVSGLLRVGDEPFVVPDSVIDIFQRTEFKLLVDTASDERPKRKRRRRRSVEERAPENDQHPVTISTKSYLQGIEALDDESRSALLPEVLGLAS